MKRIVMAGITGRTGKAVANVLRRLDDCQIVAAVGKNSAGRDIGELLEGKSNFRYIYPDVPSALEKTDADVYIDFTAPDAAQKNAVSAAKHGLDIIIGTTGLTKESVECIAELLREENRFGIIASNFAIGIAAMVKMGNILREYYGGEELQIIEKHHTSKRDCPSGTALYLQQQLDLTEDAIIAKRVAEKASYHEIKFAAKNENLSISYEVTGREVFGEGVAYILRNMPNSGVYYDFLSFIEHIEKRK